MIYKSKKIYSLIVLLCIISPFFINSEEIGNFTENHDRNTENKDIAETVDGVNQRSDNLLPKISQSTSYNSTLKYIWWNNDWTYRIPMEYNSSFMNRINASVEFNVNFTSIAENIPGLSNFNLDSQSIRIVECDADGNLIEANNLFSDNQKYLLKSRFITTKYSYNAITNATGIVRFEVPGMTYNDTSRVFMLYFDIMANGPKTAINDALLWKQAYDYTNDPINDGSSHLIYGNQQDASGYGELTIWNDDLSDTMGEPSQWDRVRNYFINTPGDFDGDGDIELLVGELNSEFKFIDYNEDTQRWESIWNDRYYYETISDPNNTFNSVHYDIYAYDIDRDGQDEIIAPQYGTYDHVVDIYKLNTTTYELYLERVITVPSFRCINMRLADLNQDGWMDFVLMYWGGTTDMHYQLVYLLWNTTIDDYSIYRFQSDSVEDQIPRYVYSMLVDDIDDDGAVEVLMTYSQSQGRVYLWEWNGTHLEYQTKFDTNVYSGQLGDIADWDNDGRKEIVFGNYRNTYANTLRVYEVVGNNTLNLTHPEWFNTVNAFSYPTNVQFGDPDNDGETELIASAFRGSDTGDYYDAQIQVFSQDDMLTPEWISPEEGQYVGAYSVYTRNMMRLLGESHPFVMPIADNVTLFTSSPEIKPPDLEVTVYDTDYHPIEGLSIQLDNNTIGNDDYEEILVSNDEGIVEFSDLSFESYNLNVTYENDFGIHSLYSGIVKMNLTREYVSIFTDYWDVSLVVEDLSGNPVGFGNISIFNGDIEDSLEAPLVIDGSGSAEYNVINRESGSNEYNYSIYYIQPDYTINNYSLLNGSFEQQPNTLDSFDLNASIPTILPGNKYEYSYWIYANGTTGTSIPNLGDQSINWVNISFVNVSAQIEEVSVFGVDQAGASNYLTTYDLSGQSLDTWDQELWLWNYTKSLYAINIQIISFNDTVVPQWGELNTYLEETYVHHAQVPLLQQKITLIDEAGGTPIQGATVEIWADGAKLVSLNSDDQGVALDSFGFNFWNAPRDGIPGTDIYTGKVIYGGAEKSFKNDSSSDSYSDTYDFTLTAYNEVTFRVRADMSNYTTELAIVDNSGYTGTIDFESQLSFNVNISGINSYTGDSVLFDAELVGFIFSDINGTILLSNTSATWVSEGIYHIFIDPVADGIPVVEGQNFFDLYIYAETIGYGESPIPISKTIQINPIITTGDLYHNSNPIGATLEVYWGNMIEIQLVYQDNGNDIGGAAAQLSWAYDTESMMEQSGSGYTNYTFTIDTSKSSSLGQFRVDVDVTLENYTQQSLFFDLIIQEIPTTINSDDYENSIDIYWSENFTFSIEYDDIHNIAPISSADVYYYIFGDPTFTKYYLTESGTPGTYTIELNSSDLGPAEIYNFQIIAEKEFFKLQQIWITVNVSIIPTQMDVDPFATELYWSHDLDLSLHLNDIRTGMLPITAANVFLSITGPSYSSIVPLPYNATDQYTLSFDTSSLPGAGTYTFTLNASKYQYKYQENTTLVSVLIIPTNLISNSSRFSTRQNEAFGIGLYFEETDGTASPITTGATVSYSVSDGGAYSDSGTIVHDGAGWYNETFVGFSTAGTYIFEITASKPEYETQTTIITVEVGLVETSMSAVESVINVYWGLNFTIDMRYFETDGDTGIVGATLHYSESISELISGNLDEDGDGDYSMEFNTTSLLSNGTYTIQINATKAGYNSQLKVITVNVLVIPTLLSNELIDNQITTFWGRDFTIAVQYFDIRNAGSPSIITTATATYNVQGLMSGELLYDDADYYTKQFDTEDFGQAGTYSFQISVSKNQYVVQTVLITVVIQEINTDFTINETEYQRIWRENLTLEFEFSDTTNTVPIEDGSVEYYIGQVSGFSGTISHTTDGKYQLVLNTTQFPSVGSYTIHITAEKSQYQTQTLTVYLTITRVDTLINGDIFLTDDVSINVSTEYIVTFTYTESGGTPVTNATIAFYEWQTATTNGVGDLEDLGDGNYRLDFDTETKEIGTYILVVHIGKENLYERAGSITLDIQSRPISITLPTSLASKVIRQPEGDEIVIEFDLVDPITDEILTGAQVTMSYRGKTYNFVEDTPGHYTYTIDTTAEEFQALFAADTNQAVIQITKANYTVSEIDITISVTPPEFQVGSVAIPRIFVYIGGSVALVAIAIAGVVRAVKIANIPLVIKQIDKTKKIIQKNNVMEDDNIMKSFEEDMEDLYGDAWKVLDLDLLKILTENKVEATDSIAPSDVYKGGEF